MSKPKPFSQRVPVEELPEAIFGLLTDKHHTADELARTLGYSANAIRERLNALKTDGFVLRESTEYASGRHYVWRVNPGASGIPFPESSGESRAGKVAQPHQKTVRAYPTVGRCDALVGAFFGPARKEAT